MKHYTVQKFTNEGHVKKAIKQIFVYFGVWQCMPRTAGYGRSGIPDYIGCIRGHFLAVEAKFGTRKPNENQVRELGEIKDAGGIGIVVSQHNLDDLVNILQQLTGIK